MLVQRGGIELREDENLIEAGIQTIADRDIDQAVVARQWHGRLTTVLRQGIKARASTPTHNNTDNARKGRHDGSEAYFPSYPDLPQAEKGEWWLVGRTKGGLHRPPSHVFRLSYPWNEQLGQLFGHRNQWRAADAGCGLPRPSARGCFG